MSIRHRFRGNTWEDRLIRDIDGPRIYDTRRWKRLRARHLLSEPFCRVCGAPATDVDHIVRIVEDPSRAFDPANLQSLCHRCHSSKTMTETIKQQPKAKPDPETGLPMGDNHWWSKDRWQ